MTGIGRTSSRASAWRSIRSRSGCSAADSESTRSISAGRIKRMQFDEYQAQVVQQRPVNDPRPLFQLSQGPAPFAYNILANGTSPYLAIVGITVPETSLGSTSTLHPGYVHELERHGGVPDQREQPAQGVLYGIGRRTSGGKLEYQRLPDKLAAQGNPRCKRRPSPTRRPICPIRSSAPSITWPTPATPATTPARSSIRNALLARPCGRFVLHLLESAGRLRQRLRHLHGRGAHHESQPE